jgi:hypothetical protein
MVECKVVQGTCRIISLECGQKVELDQTSD